MQLVVLVTRILKKKWGKPQAVVETSRVIFYKGSSAGTRCYPRLHINDEFLTVNWSCRQGILSRHRQSWGLRSTGRPL